MKNVLKVLILAGILLMGGINLAHADPLTISLTIRDSAAIVYENSAVPLLPAGTISLSDSAGAPHDIDANSVLGILGSIDQTSGDFEISEIRSEEHTSELQSHVN